MSKQKMLLHSNEPGSFAILHSLKRRNMFLSKKIKDQVITVKTLYMYRVFFSYPTSSKIVLC